MDDNREEMKLISKSAEKSTYNSKDDIFDEGFPGTGSSIELFPSDVNPYYTNKEEIEQKLNFMIPYYVVKECKESSKRPDGWYKGEAIIEFDCVIDDVVLNHIKSELKQQHKRCIKWLPGEFLIPILNPNANNNGEYWVIIFKENSSLGKIRYRTARPEYLMSTI